jgi:hypothetical protein
MSGPIVRKYGFPNFEKIFGERDLEHGVDESDDAASEGPAAGKTDAAAPAEAKPKKAKKK